MLSRIQGFLMILGMTLVFISAAGLVLLAAGRSKWSFSVHDTYFVVVRISPVFVIVMLVLGIALWLYGACRTA